MLEIDKISVINTPLPCKNSENQRNLSKELMRRNNFQTLTLATFLEIYLPSAMLLCVMCSKMRFAMPVALPHNKTVNMHVN